jgi:signal peptide peptidase SppA
MMAVDDLLAHLASFDPVVALNSDYLARFILRESLQAAAGSAPARQGSISVIPIQGMLVPRGARSAYGSWQGMDTLRSQIRSAANDPEVAAIVLDIDSPGGTVAGTAETAAEVKAAAEKKPVHAVANALTASAAYWIGSQATQFNVTPGSDVGSIGAMVMHMDVSEALASMGIKVTVVKSAANKNETAPFGPLSEDTMAHLQSRVSDAGEEFIKAVASGRRTSQTNVRDNFGQGRMFAAGEAVKRGMADRVATLDETIAALAQGAQARSSRKRASALFD